MDEPSSKDRLMTTFFLLLFLAGAAVHILQAAGEGERLGVVAGSLIFGLLALSHAWYLLGWRTATAMFGFVYGASWTAQTLAIATHLATPYAYTEALGPRIGLVPFTVPLTWFTMFYFSTVIANLIGEGKPSPTIQKGWWVACMAFLTALVVTAWDLAMHPWLLLQQKAWVFKYPGPYFGIPFAAFLAGLQTAFIISVVWRLVETSLPDPPPDRLTRLATAIPVLAYGVLALPFVFVGTPEATRILTPFSMGIPVLAALGRLTQMPQPLSFPEPEP